ncbi:MAG: TonB family protein, partial [Salinivenus sp.]
GVVACSDSVAPSAPSSDASPPTGDSETANQTGASDEVFVEVEKRPECGGVRALADHIQYPDLAHEAGIEGRVFVQFVVDENGDVTDPTVTKGVHEALDAAALSAVKKLECKPGQVRGEPVKVRMALPVTFRLDGGADESNDDAAPSSATPAPDSGGRLFEKAGIQVVRVLMNEEGDLLLDDEPVDESALTDAVRQRITKDAARAALLHADGAPTDRVDAVEARLRALDLQKVYVQKVE